MIERLVEHWLDSAGERSYQPCFCQMLVGQGYRIVHSTRHTPLEFGKDVIAVAPDGRLVAYQLKGNPSSTLSPRNFDEIRGQLEQLATLAITVPGFRTRTADECYLVTNGNIDEGVYHQIQTLNASLEGRGHAPEKIKTITRGTLLEWAQSLGYSLWPSEVQDISDLLKLLNCQGDEIFPAEVFHRLLLNTLALDRNLKRDELRRRLTSAGVMTSVALQSFSRKANHFAEITAWLMFATYSVAAATRANSPRSRDAQNAILVAKDAIYDRLGQICDELENRKTLAEGDPLSDFAFYRARQLILCMLMSVYWMWSEAESWKRPEHKSVVEKFLPDALGPNWLWGEGAIPHIITFLWYRRKVDATLRYELSLEHLLQALLESKQDDCKQLASPYYSIEDTVRHQYHRILNCRDPLEGYDFGGESYFAESLLLFLVRANRKQACRNLWADFTRLQNQSFVVARPWQYGLFRSEHGGNKTKIYPPTYDWKDLQAIAKEESADSVPQALRQDPILLLLFVNLFPHRATTEVMMSLHLHYDGTWMF